MLPDELEWVLEMLGFHWPTADEDRLVRCAEVWERFAEDATRLHADANRSTATVVAHNAGESIDAFRAAYEGFDGDSGHLQNAAQAATAIGLALRAAAVVVETCKIAVIAQLVALAVELISAQAAAPFTLGLSELGSLSATTATRVIVRRLLQELRRAVTEAVLDCLKEPAVSAVEAMVTDLVRQSVDVGFGAQHGYDLGATTQAGAKGAWAAARQTPQTFLEGLRDSMGSQAGGAARGRLDGCPDAHAPFRDGAEGATPASAPADTGRDGGPLDPAGKDDLVFLSADGPGPLSVPGPAPDATGPVDVDGDKLPSPGGDAGPGPAFHADGGRDYPLPAPRGDGPSLPDFDGDHPPSAPPGGGVAAPVTHSAPAHSSPPPAGTGGGALRTEIDSLAAHAPTHPARAHTPHVPDPAPAPPRGDLGGAPPSVVSVPTGHPGAGPQPGTHTPGPGPNTAPRTAPPAAGPAPAQPAAPAGPTGDGAPPSAPRQHTTVGPAPGPAQPHAAPPRTPASPGPHAPQAPAPEQPGGGHRGDPGTHEQGARQTDRSTPSSTSRGHTAVPAPAVLMARRGRLTGSHPAGPGALSRPAGPAGDGGPAFCGLHTVRAELAHEPGGLSPVDPGDQQALESAVPRDTDGVPKRFPDPFGAWVLLQNGIGTQAPGRGNNAADCSRAFLETWYGNPQVAAPRTPDADAFGRPDPWSPEADALAHQERWAGAPHTHAGTGADPETAARIEQVLLRHGHGSAALVQVDWSGGGGHAFNAVNHEGTVVWVDSQSGEAGHEPLHLAGADHVWHIPLDPDGVPVEAAPPEPVDEPEPEPGNQPGSEPGSGDGSPPAPQPGRPVTTEGEPAHGTRRP